MITVKILTCTLFALLASLLLIEFWPRLAGTPVRCDGGEGQDELIERAARMIYVKRLIDNWYEGIEK